MLIATLCLVLAVAQPASRVEKHAVGSASAVVRVATQDGRVVESKLGGERRVLIELRARPVLDRSRPGSVADVSQQHRQLARSLAILDAKAKTPSHITRHYHALFSGVAATVDAEVVPKIRRLPEVRAVHEDVEVRAQLAESVPLIGATSVSSTYGVNGSGVKVAVIDTGIDYTHPDLGGCFGGACKVAGGWDFVNDDADPTDDHGHGTHVAGIVAANGSTKGVAPGATLLAYKVLNQFGSGLNSDIIAALEQAVVDGAKIANLSLGGLGSPDDPTSQAVDNATAAGMLSVIAAGNSGPRYRTVSSPGLARTALTVGAIHKAGWIADFSSRGPGVAGEEHLMKPEITAPGVSIRSTVPTTGIHGDPTRYASLSGTSMAAPHLAGAAALLLQWKPLQTPAEIKNRLVGAARGTDENHFTEGAGTVDLVSAFALPALSSASEMFFGVVTGTSGIVDLQRTLSIRNMVAGATTFSLTANGALPDGATLEITPASITLQEGQSADVTLRLRVDTSVTPEPPDPLSYSTRLAIAGPTGTTNVLVYFMRGSLLTLSFEEAPSTVYLISQDLHSTLTFRESALSLSAVVQSGNWDVLVLYPTAYATPISMVVREQVAVQNRVPLSILRSEANRALTLRPVDDEEQPLFDQDGATQLVLALRASDVPNATEFALMFLSGRFPQFRLPALSSRYLVGIQAGAPAPNQRYFLYGWSNAGLPADVVLPEAGTPMRRLEQSAVSVPNARIRIGVSLALKMREMSLFSTLLNGTLTTGHSAPAWTLHLQTTSTTGLPLLMGSQSLLNVVDASGNITDAIDGPFLRYDGTEIELDRWTFDVLDPLRTADAALGGDVERWDADALPNSLPLQFQNGSSWIAAHDRHAQPGWVSSTLGHLKLSSGSEPQFSLYRNAALVGTYPLSSLRHQSSEPAGPHEIRSTSSYRIAGVAGTSHVVASFDTNQADPNPPYIASFRIEQDGVRTATPFRPSLSPTTKVMFRGTDDTSLATVSLAWRPNGTTSWTVLPLSHAGDVYTAPFEMEGSIDLRLTATDAIGNRFEQEWTPAAITEGPTPPTQPSFIQAAAEGPSSVRVSWGASSSTRGLREYRVERLPGSQVFIVPPSDTSFLDSNGITNGSLYLYRVSAVDLDGVYSPPTAYDLASLVSFQDDPVVAGATLIRGIHVAQLRRSIDLLRQAAGLQSAWGDYTPPSGIVAASDFIAMRDKMNEARSVLQLPLVNANLTPGASIRALHLAFLRNGVRDQSVAISITP